MKISKMTFPALAAMALAFAGCNQDENLPGGNTDERVAIRVSSNIDTESKVQKTGTRAVDNQWEQNDAIGIFMLNGTTPEKSNIAYNTTNGSAFSPMDETIYLPAEKPLERDFVAYYPHTETLNNNAYTISLADQTDQSAIDFMTSAKVTGVTKNKPDVDFIFQHRLAKLRLKITAQDGFNPDQSELAGLKIELTGQQTTGTYNVLTDNAVAIVPANGIITLNTAGNGQTAEAIVFPSENYDNMAFQFTVDGHAEPYIWNLSESTKATNFEEGREYIYNITINRTGINVTATIKPWDKGNGDGETGSAE